MSFVLFESHWDEEPVKNFRMTILHWPNNSAMWSSAHSFSADLKLYDGTLSRKLFPHPAESSGFVDTADECYYFDPWHGDSCWLGSTGIQRCRQTVLIAERQNFILLLQLAAERCSCRIWNWRPLRAHMAYFAHEANTRSDRAQRPVTGHSNATMDITGGMDPLLGSLDGTLSHW